MLGMDSKVSVGLEGLSTAVPPTHISLWILLLREAWLWPFANPSHLGSQPELQVGGWTLVSPVKWSVHRGDGCVVQIYPI